MQKQAQGDLSGALTEQEALSSDSSSAFTNADMGLGVPPVVVSKHCGFPITRSDDGFSWANGGYFDTYQECCEDIDDWSEADSINDPCHPNFGNIVRAGN